MKLAIKRIWVQIASALASNSYFAGFVNGTIYKGSSKAVCFPGLNCYSCPGAVLACPVGALQSVIGSYKYQFTWYVTGTLLLFGMIAGRWICGWLCPFGLFQELIYRIPGRKLKVPRKFRWLQFTKYAILAIFVILLPLLAVNAAGLGDPWFCKYICPAGTLFGAVPLLAVNEALREATGGLFAWKLSLALLIVAASIVLYRFFCRFLCPLGAIYGLLNRLSLYRMKLDNSRCMKCGACASACKMDIEPYKTPNSCECIRCGNCRKACPHSALTMTVTLNDIALVKHKLPSKATRR